MSKTTEQIAQARKKFAPEVFTLRLKKRELGYEMYLYTAKLGEVVKFGLVAWLGNKRTSPDVWKLYSTEQERTVHVERIIRESVAEFKSKAARRGAQNAPHSFAVGDILDGSYGYDQTQVEFHEVVGVSANYVTLRELAQQRQQSEIDGGSSTPRPGEHIGKPTRHKVIDGCVRINESMRARLWDGKSRRWSTGH